MAYWLADIVRSDLLPRTGGCFALLTLLHFTVDWVFQSHDEAMAKSRDWAVRLRHCSVYTMPFVLVMAASTWSLLPCFGACAILFVSHFVEDTYLPVLWWAKYVRRPPTMRRRLVWHEGWWAIREGKETRYFRSDVELRILKEVLGHRDHPRQVMDHANPRAEAQRRLDLDGFISFVGDPLGKILLIAIDQIVHLLFLVPVAYMLARQP